MKAKTKTLVFILATCILLLIAYETTATLMMPDREAHYARNENNTFPVPESEAEVPNDWLTSDIHDKTHKYGFAANAHQFTSPDRSNVKYVSPDGRTEAIYDSEGILVTDDKDVGTYNFIPPFGLFGAIGHHIKDVRPWIIWGNTREDTTTVPERIFGLLGIYF